MQLQDSSVSVTPDRLQNAIASSQNHLLSIQSPAGYWQADLESNVTMTAEVVLLHKIWDTDTQRPLPKAETYLRQEQKDHGGWELYYGDGGDLSTSVEAYMALRLLGVGATDPALVAAREFILQRGGISKTRIFTKLHLALIGCYDWRGVPSIPPWLMLLPDNFPFTIYEMSSWARGSTVPLLIVFDQKPVFAVNPAIKLDELYSEGIENVKYELPKNNDWTDIFTWLDDAFKWSENLNLVPFRQEGLKAAEKWVLERQEASGDWGGIIPAMLNSLLALRCLRYSKYDPIVERGLQAVDRFAVETDEIYWVQPCVSPVWDTALVMRALVESGIEPNHPQLTQAGEWLLEKQILDYGDWAVKNKWGKPGAWAFEFENRFYPDVDDSAVVMMALAAVELPNEELKQAAINRCLHWIVSMQCNEGGWAAFDLNNNQNWLNYLPYADLKAMIDPNTVDVTARVLEMMGRCDLSVGSKAFKAALAYIICEQETDGSWFGRWGVNYIYGTSGALSALSLIAAESHYDNIERGANWLQSCQNEDGGWGETCKSYDDPIYKGQGESTASQTAWALTGLMAAVEAANGQDIAPKPEWQSAIASGIDYLIRTQHNGQWDEPYFTGTGFPSHFYLKYHLYQQHFSLAALGRYRKMAVGSGQ
ncbi:MAG: squalene--hopene cyclase [Jaaginema sp. PMC 1079.18]|nr:squalene--hopene cyclase [Jaaginema sp. PMC 1080.18]MEC4851972.1 squalene--hopene cyclase [Jaaginema sp. PMC 1079.18]MEC4868378.1 squalene--hopene cyclase [Jaaginema sp. PMC 1078.18]